MDPTDPLLSTGDVARELGVSRDSLMWALKMGVPGPQDRIAGRRVYQATDVAALRRWFNERKLQNRTGGGKGGA